MMIDQRPTPGVAARAVNPGEAERPFRDRKSQGHLLLYWAILQQDPVALADFHVT